MTTGNLDAIIEEMRKLGMVIPERGVQISIPDAEQVLRNALTYFIGLRGENAEWLPEYAAVAEWLNDNKQRGLFLCGDCGRGKSVLARFVIPAILLKYSGKVLRCYDVAQMNNEIDVILSKHLISLDDIGTEEVSVKYGNRRQAFAEIVDAAEKYGKLLVISTNLDKTAIVEKYGERVFDRLVAVTKRVEFKGKSLRK